MSLIISVFSYDAFQHSVNLLSKFPGLSVQQAISHSTPAVSWMKECVPDRHVFAATQALTHASTAKYEIESVTQKGEVLLIIML